MTFRERVLAVLRGEKADMVPWFGDMDYYTTAQISQGRRPADFRERDQYIEWHRGLRCGFYLQGYFPFNEIIESATSGSGKTAIADTGRSRRRKARCGSAGCGATSPTRRRRSNAC